MQERKGHKVGWKEGHKEEHKDGKDRKGHGEKTRRDRKEQDRRSKSESLIVCQVITCEVHISINIQNSSAREIFTPILYSKKQKLRSVK